MTDGSPSRNIERIWSGWPAALIIILVAIATRWAAYGNPVADVDDQFYWLVGTSMQHGQWPILDIWDRKPIGLFLIYGAIAKVSPSILAVQFAATLFAAATAFLIRQIALNFAGPRSATLAAISYLLFLPIFGGQTGQSPVFYNLFMAGAGLITVRALRSDTGDRLLLRAIAAMLLCGLALVVKQVSLVEGAYFGLALLWVMRRHGWPHLRILATALLMALTALLPTIAGFAMFAAKGAQAFDSYAYAAYLSIFAKGATAAHAHTNGLIYFLIFASPLLVAALFALPTRPEMDGGARAKRFMIGWLVAATVGYVMIPNFFPHYALPLMVPLSAFAALAFERRVGLILFVAMVGASLASGKILARVDNLQSAARYAELAKAVNDNRDGGCLYVLNGPAALYATVSACRVTGYLFPYHLSLATEAAAVGISQDGQLKRIFEQKPAIVVTQDRERPNQTLVVRNLVDAELAADYEQVFSTSDNGDFQLNTVRVWKRRTP